MMQVEHALVANVLQVVMKEVVETTRENFIIGLNEAWNFHVYMYCRLL